MVDFPIHRPSHLEHDRIIRSNELLTYFLMLVLACPQNVQSWNNNRRANSNTKYVVCFSGEVVMLGPKVSESDYELNVLFLSCMQDHWLRQRTDFNTMVQ